MKRRFWSILLALSLVVGLLPSTALASGAVTADEIADFTADDGGEAALALLTGGDASLASWDPSGRVLTLSGVDFTTTKPVGVMLPDDTTIVLTEGTDNRIVSNGSIREGDSCGIACGELSLIWYEMSNQQGYEVSLLGDLTLRGQGTLYARGGGIDAANSGYYSMGIGAHRLTITEGTITAEGGTVENGASSVGISTSYLNVSGDEKNGDITISGGHVISDGIRARLGTLSISGDAVVHSSGLVSASTLYVSGGELTAEGTYGISASLNIAGGEVTARGTLYGIGDGNEESYIRGGTVTVEGGTVGSCLFDSTGLTVTGGEFNCTGSFWSRTLSVSGGTMRVTATPGMPAVGLTCRSAFDFTPEVLSCPQLGTGIELRYRDDSGHYQSGAMCLGYLYNFYEKHPGEYITVKSYSALFEADGTTLASDIRIAPPLAEDAESQISALDENSTVESVNQAADTYVELSAEEQEKVSVESVRVLDALVEEKNGLTVTKDLPEDAEITVDGLALASGVAQDTSVRTTALSVTDVTDTAQARVAEALLELDFTLTVDGAAAQPAVPVVVSIPCTEGMKSQVDDLKVIHLTEGGEREEVPYALSENGDRLTFRAASFSGYAVVGDPANTPVDSLTFLSAYRVQTPQSLTGSCTMIVAAYDASGRMTEVRRCSAPEANQIWLLAWRTAPERCRAFLLGERQRPMSPCGTWENAGQR